MRNVPYIQCVWIVRLRYFVLILSGHYFLKSGYRAINPQHVSSWVFSICNLQYIIGMVSKFTKICLYSLRKLVIQSRGLEGSVLQIHIQTGQDTLIGDDDGEYTPKSEGVEEKSVSGCTAPEGLMTDSARIKFLHRIPSSSRVEAAATKWFSSDQRRWPASWCWRFSSPH